jgi:hypothetical protein
MCAAEFAANLPQAALGAASGWTFSIFDIANLEAVFESICGFYGLRKLTRRNEGFILVNPRRRGVNSLDVSPHPKMKVLLKASPSGQRITKIRAHSYADDSMIFRRAE